MEGYILALNCGSSSLKFNLFNTGQENNKIIPCIQGIVEEIGNKESSRIKYEFNGEKTVENMQIMDHRGAMSVMFDTYGKFNIRTGDIKAVGHRVVHGGEKYSSSVKIDGDVIKTIRELFPIAPLHNPPNLTGIEEAIRIMPDIPQVAVFDTAFHASMPEYAYRYAVPEKWYRDYGVRKYGFHGTSHMYVAKRASRLLGIPYNEFNGITAHLGNGCSITKIQNGKSVDTSMGFTPLQGVIMGTRSGDIDPAVIPHVVDRIVKDKGSDKMEVFNKVMGALNKESGLKAIGGTNMMQLIREKALSGDEEADRIISIYAYRVAHYIGSYWATLGNNHAVIFTAGLGENEGYVRKRILSFLANFNIIVDDEKNSIRKEELEIARTGSTSIMVTPTNEEAVIGYDTLYLGFLGKELPERYPFEV